MEKQKNVCRIDLITIVISVAFLLICLTGNVAAETNDASTSQLTVTSQSSERVEQVIDRGQDSNVGNNPSQIGGSNTANDESRPVEDGDYNIAWHADNSYVVNVKNSASGNSNVEISRSNGGTSQCMRIKYISEDGGYYSITNVVTGQSMDVYNSKGRAYTNGANVQMYKPNGGKNQRWSIVRLSTGGYKIWSLINGKVLDILGGIPKSGSNVQIWDSNDSHGQVFDFIRKTDVPSNKTVEDGDYVIGNSENGFKVVDAYKGSATSNDGTNIEVYDANGGAAQKFHIEFIYDRFTGGYYRIIHAASGKALDVSGASMKSGANVQLWTSNDSVAQKWLIKKLENGFYNIIMMASGNVLDISHGNLANGTNITVYKPNGGSNQQFSLKPFADVTTQLEDGVYSIISSKDGRVVEVENPDSVDNANVHINDSNADINQKFIVQKCSDGKYRIMSCVNGKVFDVYKGYSNNGTNVIAWLINNGANQKFVVRKTGDGSYYITAASGKVVEVAAGSDNVEINDGKGTDNQEFSFTKIMDYKPVNDGAYVIESKGDSDYVIDVYKKGTQQKVNIELYKKNGGNNQIFNIIQGTDGLYTIRNVYSRHVLDVDHGYLKDGTNVMQYAVNNGLNQKWLAVVNTDGSVTFVNGGTGRALDVNSAKYNNGTNIAQWMINGTDAQKFVLVPTTYDKSLDSRPIDYSIYTPDTFWTRIGATAKSLGNSLWNAYNWVAGFRRYYLTSNGRTSWPIMSSKDYAIYGLNHHGGDCIVMASTLRYIAQYLGYNAIQRFGYVGSATHSWVEINGKVYDSNFKNETGRNGFGISYGQRGTWKYRIVTNI